MRLKKNAQIQEAMSTLRKDLYDWKTAINVLKPNREPSSTSLKSTSSGRTTPSFPQLPPKLKSLDSNSLVNKSNSLKDLTKPTVNKKMLHQKVKPLLNNKKNNYNISSDLSDSELQDQDFFDDTDFNQKVKIDLKTRKKSFEFIKTFKDKPPVPKEPTTYDNKDVYHDRVYLVSALSILEPMDRDPKSIEEGLVS
jgi:hypothetical protein